MPKPGVPESFKVLLKELQSLCLDMRVLDKDGNEIELKDDDDDTFTPSRDLYDDRDDDYGYLRGEAELNRTDGYSFTEGSDDNVIAQSGVITPDTDDDSDAGSDDDSDSDFGSDFDSGSMDMVSVSEDFDGDDSAYSGDPDEY